MKKKEAVEKFTRQVRLFLSLDPLRYIEGTVTIPSSEGPAFGHDQRRAHIFIDPERGGSQGMVSQFLRIRFAQQTGDPGHR